MPARFPLSLEGLQLLLDVSLDKLELTLVQLLHQGQDSAQEVLITVCALLSTALLVLQDYILALHLVI